MNEEDDFISLLIQPTDEESLAFLKYQEAQGKRIQVWRLFPGATTSDDGQWEDLPDPMFHCPVHLYRVHPEDV